MMLIVATSVFACFFVTNATIVLSPKNTVTQTGRNVSFVCGINDSPSASPNWRYSTNGIRDNEVAIVRSCSVNASYASQYETTYIANGTCILTVLNPTLQQAGVYSCLDTQGNVFGAVLTIIEKNAVLSPTISDVKDGQILTMSCSVSCIELIAPYIVSINSHLSWTNTTAGSNITGTYSKITDVTTGITVITTNITVTATKPTFPSYACTAYFTISGSNSAWASNLPNDTYTWRTNSVNVSFSPEQPAIHSTYWIVQPSGSGGPTCILLELNCTSSAYPSANYMWLDVTDSGNKIQLSNSPLFPYAENGRTYECFAYNSIGNATTRQTVNHTDLPCKSPEYVWISRDCMNSSCSCSNRSNYIEVTECSPSTQTTTTDTFPTPSPSNQTTTTHLNQTSIPYTFPRWAELAIIIVGTYLVLNLVSMIIFLVIYARNSNAGQKQKTDLNKRFPWLQKMLPCLNKYSVECRCGLCCWVFLFIVISFTIGVFFFPILLFLGFGKCCLKKTIPPTTLSLAPDIIRQPQSEQSRYRNTAFPPYTDVKKLNNGNFVPQDERKRDQKSANIAERHTPDTKSSVQLPSIHQNRQTELNPNGGSYSEFKPHPKPNIRPQQFISENIPTYAPLDNV